MRSGAKARRHPSRARPRFPRRAALAACVGLTVWAQAGSADVTAAHFADETRRYPHGVLGDDVEYGTLVIETGGAETPSEVIEVTLPETRVFEDLSPRLWDITGNGAPEVIVVESDAQTGAQLAVYNAEGVKIAATPHIGQRNRWLAPIGAADLDGDGHIEVAYIDRPHLAKTLRIWRFQFGTLEEVASAPGLTNHLIGEDFITSGMRECGQGPELITVNAAWTRVMASRLVEGAIESRDLGPFDKTEGLTAAMGCALP